MRLRACSLLLVLLGSALMAMTLGGCEQSLFRNEDSVSQRKMLYFDEDQTATEETESHRSSTGMGFGMPNSGASGY